MVEPEISTARRLKHEFRDKKTAFTKAEKACSICISLAQEVSRITKFLLSISIEGLVKLYPVKRVRPEAT